MSHALTSSIALPHSWLQRVLLGEAMSRRSAGFLERDRADLDLCPCVAAESSAVDSAVLRNRVNFVLTKVRAE